MGQPESDPANAPIQTASDNACILIVDDEPSVRDGLKEWFAQESWSVDTAADAADALALLGKRSYQIALLDIRLPGMDGLELQKRIHRHDPSIAIILMTAYASVDTAVSAMKEGAYDYITKPFKPDEFTAVIHNALRDRQTTAPSDGGPEIIGNSPAVRKVLALADAVASSDATILLLGESGTGKELLARRIHARSERRLFPFVPVNCGGLSETLLESELFGHEKGAFTGAQYRRKGRLELADRGTLFLDEVGEIPTKMQVDLLRVLEDRQITRLGADRSIDVDFRVIAATHQDLFAFVSEGRFRQDLYYRLNVVSITLPPLRERREDIPLIADHFLDRFAATLRKPVKRFSVDAVDRLVSYPWRGNIRELRNVVERAVILAAGDVIGPDHVLTGPETEPQPDSSTIESLERAHILAILRESGGNMTQAAKRLGIDRSTLYRKMDRYNLAKPNA